MWGIQAVDQLAVDRVRFLTERIETGILFVLLAIAVGILTEISLSVRANISSK
jgi:hypothetical protein